MKKNGIKININRISGICSCILTNDPALPCGVCIPVWRELVQKVDCEEITTETQGLMRLLQ